MKLHIRSQVSLLGKVCYMAIRKALLEQVICENDERATEIKCVWGGGGREL